MLIALQEVHLSVYLSIYLSIYLFQLISTYSANFITRTQLEALFAHMKVSY